MATKEIIPATLAESRAAVSAAQQKAFGKDDDVLILEDFVVESPILNYVSTGSFWLDLAIAYPKGAGLPMPAIIEIVGDPSSTKAQPLDAKLFYVDGWHPMADVRVGDTIYGRDNWTTVVGIFPHGEREVYRITFSDSATVECTLEHLWEVDDVKTSRTRVPHRFAETEILSVEEILRRGLKKGGRARFRVPELIKPIELPSRDLAVDPYVMGLLIGNGCFRSSCEGELVAAIAATLPCGIDISQVGRTEQIGQKVDWRIASGVRKGGAENEFTSRFKQLGLMGHKSVTKWIPDDYKYSSVADRIALLQGLMDTDGCADKQGHVFYSTGSPRLALDFTELVRSLGGRAAVSDETVNGQVYWRICFRMLNDIVPFRLKRKLKRYRVTRATHRTIESIDLVGRKPCQCIQVSAQDGLYLTDGFVLTHNSSLALRIAASVQRLGGWVQLHDEERTFTEWYGKTAGLSLSATNFQYCYSASVEKVFELIRTTAEAHFSIAPHIPFCCIWDSLAGTATEEERKAIEEGKETRRAGHAAIVAREFRNFGNVMAAFPFLMIFVNQYKSSMDPNPWAAKWINFGGQAIKYHARVRIETMQGTHLKWRSTDPHEYGLRVRTKILKNKVGFPWRKPIYDFDFLSGVEDFYPSIEWLRDVAKTLPKNGNFVVFDGKSWYIDKLRLYLKSDQAALARFRQLMEQSWGSVEIGAKEELLVPTNAAIPYGASELFND